MLVRLMVAIIMTLLTLAFCWNAEDDLTSAYWITNTLFIMLAIGL